jgi:error-prone DNA polymerase
VNESDWNCTLEESEIRNPKSEVNPKDETQNSKQGFRESPNSDFEVPSDFGFRISGFQSLRLGFRLIKGLPQTAGQMIRGLQPYRSVLDFARRTQLGRPVLVRLASADAFGSLGLSRREALWHVLSAGEELPLFAGIDNHEEATPLLAEMPLYQHVVADYDTVGLSLKAHPVGLVRTELSNLGVLRTAELDEQPDKSHVRVAGLVIVRQQPATSKGTIFITIEDETGIVNLVVWRHICQRYRLIVRNAVALIAHGRLERADNVTHLIVTRLEDLSEWLAAIESKSRDFR